MRFRGPVLSFELPCLNNAQGVVELKYTSRLNHLTELFQQVDVHYRCEAQSLAVKINSKITPYETYVAAYISCF